MFEWPSDRPGAAASGPGAATKEHLRLMREAILHSPHHMAVFDAEERLVAWSLNYEAFHHPVFDDLRAEGRVETVRFPEFVERSLARIFSGEALREAVATRLAQHRTADGAPTERHFPGKGWWRITKMPIPSGGVMTVGVDITDLKENAAELDAARRAAVAASAAKSAFLANMSHEFRTPLNGVLGVAALLEATPLDPRQRELLALLRSSGKALLAMVDDVLDLSMAEAGGLRLKAEVFRPAAVLDEVTRLLASDVDPARLAIEARADAGCAATLRGDATRFRQVLWNLLGNAIKFAPEGRIAATLAATPAVGRIRIDGVVEDTGPGVPEADRERVFERFQQAGDPGGDRPPGAGLGLAICRAIVEAMGGAIGVETAEGGGARFRFHLLLDPA